MPLIRQVATSLVRRPWYTASIVTTLAVGAALLTSVLAIVDGVLFKPLGYPGEQDLVAIELWSNSNASPQSVGPDDLAEWSHAAPGTAFTGFNQQTTDSAWVLPNFFDVIGVQPALGGFSAEDFAAATLSGIHPRIVTDAVFRAEFGGDPSAIGRVVIEDPTTGSGYRLAGVMPRGFTFPAMRGSVGYLRPHPERGLPRFFLGNVIARTPPNGSPTGIAAAIQSVVAARNGDRPGTSSGSLPIDRVRVVPLGRALGASSRPLFTALLAAAAFLVAIAALNASSLMAARSVDRRRELSVRRALGATRLDITRLVLVEAWLLVGTAVALGLAIASPLLQLVARLLPDDLALFKPAAIDWRIAVLGTGAALVIAGIVAAWPLRLARADHWTPDAERSVTSPGRSLGWQFIVTTQVALALVLTVGGALLVGSLLAVYAQTPPISTRDVLTIELRFLGMSRTVGHLAPERATRVNALVDRLVTVPGVEAAAVTAYSVLQHAYEPARFRRPDTAITPGRATVTHAVTSGFYRVLEPQLVAGRLPTARELATDAPVLVVSEGVSNQFWPNGSAIGQLLTDEGRTGAGEAAMTFTVVGVVRDVQWAAWDERTLPTIYGPYALLARPVEAALLLRIAAGVPGVAANALRVIDETDPLARTGRVAMLDDLFVDSVRPRRFRAWMFGSFAFAGLFVVGLGIFGQQAMSSARRTREVGIRMACGATPGRVARLILHQQLVPVALGLVGGGIVAAWSVRFVTAYLYQVTSFDARVWATATGLILLAAATGTLIPAIRASRVDPTEALRAE